MSTTLVTGAAGFIGGWVVEAFRAAGVPVRAGIRRWNSVARLARQPIEMVACDVLSPAALRSAMDGCDSVVHCAVGNPTVTVEGTRNVLDVAAEVGVRRVVHLSSVAVYGWENGIIDESSQLSSDGNAYAQAKIEAEQVCQDAARRGLPVVMLRPTVVYGPHSEVWTVNFARRLWSGRWGTFGAGGAGRCNLVYVTDVVQAVGRALAADGLAGAAYNINGPEVITWNDYFRRFNEALGRSPLGELNAAKIARRAAVLTPVRKVARFALNRFGKPILKLHSKSALAAGLMKATESSLKLTPTRDQLRRFRQDVEYSTTKAREELCYEPLVDVAKGLEFSAAWLRHQRVLY